MSAFPALRFTAGVAVGPVLSKLVGGAAIMLALFFAGTFGPAVVVSPVNGRAAAEGSLGDRLVDLPDSSRRDFFEFKSCFDLICRERNASICMCRPSKFLGRTAPPNNRRQLTISARPGCPAMAAMNTATIANMIDGRMPRSPCPWLRDQHTISIAYGVAIRATLNYRVGAVTVGAVELALAFCP